MTIAISLKVNDGVILATDSAATMLAQNPDGQLAVVNVYENADKLFNLCKSRPIGVITWGSGSIGNSSISTLVKDFRRELQEELNDNSYSIKDVAEKFTNFIFHEKYENAFKDWENKPSLGFMVVGYSTNSNFAEEWKIDINDGKLDGPNIIRGEEETGITWNGEPEAINRLVLGHSLGLLEILKMSEIEDDKIQKVMQNIRNHLVAPFIVPALPIQDAIDLAEFLVDTSMKFSKFFPGPTTVGGPIDIATITKHEGFKWIKRKYFYNSLYNQ